MLYTFTYHILLHYTYHVLETYIFKNNISHDILSHTMYTVVNLLDVFYNNLLSFVTQSLTQTLHVVPLYQLNSTCTIVLTMVQHDIHVTCVTYG